MVEELGRFLTSIFSRDAWSLSSNWAQWLRPSAKSREDKETRALYREAKVGEACSPLAEIEACKQFLFDIVVDTCQEHGVYPSRPLGNALWDAIAGFLISEGLVIELDGKAPPEHLTLEEGVVLRATLRRHLAFIKDHKRLLPIFRNRLVILFAGILQYFPPSAFTDVDEEGYATDDAVVFPAAKALYLCENLPQAIERSIVTFFDQGITNAHLFERMREVIDSNAVRVSGITRDSPPQKLVFPTEHKQSDPSFLVDGYLSGTPLEGFFQADLPFAIPFPARFEHTHVIGGTGHGKTQLLQFLIHHDLVRAQEDGRSVVVMDSQGDLIRTISCLGYFGQDRDNSLADRYVMIDPTDIEHPPCLNMFDFNRDRLSGYAPLDREKILNATIELYDYFFGALLGAELTQRQGVIFRYIARLLIEIPGATIHTLRELMEDGEKFLPYMEKLTGTTRAFFATRFFEKQFSETKKQILARLWGVLGNSAMERMFSHKTSKIDLFALLNSGKIILINTAKDLLGQEGAAIFGRFFIALIGQAAVQRAAQKPHERRSTFVYIDETADYFDTNIGNLLTQARKYRVGLVFAHQNLDQLTPELRASVMSSTTIKFAGGVSAKDATALSHELRCESDFLLAQKRGAKHTSFACHVKNYTGKALSVSIPLGFVESQPQLSEEDAEYLRDVNRATYCGTPERVPDVPFVIRKAETAKGPKVEKKGADAIRPEPIQKEAVEQTARPEPPLIPTPARPIPRPEPKLPPTPGRGGQEHKRIQHRVKMLAEQRGFRAVIEDTVLDGAGQIDVSLVRGDLRIACEISITTGKDHELGNVEKCIAAGYRNILLIGKTERQAKTLAKFIAENLEESHGTTIHAIAHEGIADYLQRFGDVVETTETTVRGIKVKTTVQASSLEDAKKRRKTLLDVVARMRKPE